VLDILSALVPKVKSCSEALSAQAVGNALYGLQGMNSEYSEVLDILSALIPKVKSCSEALTAQAVGNALYGLQGMNSEHSEVRELLSALVPKVKSCSEALDAQAVGNALYGLQGVKLEKESLNVFEILYQQLSNLANRTVNFQSLLIADLVFLSQNMAMTLPILQEALKDDYNKWDKIKLLLVDESTRRISTDSSFLQPGNFQSSAEKQVFNIARKTFGNSSILVSSDEYLFNLFQSDIILKIPMINGPSPSHSVIINIEVDGSHHLRERKKRFCMLRDKYLKSQGVVIERIDVPFLQKMIKDDTLRDWLLKTVANAKDSNSN
jgi:hypothetical protein